MKAMCEALKRREPGNWSNYTYGSKEFAEETFSDAGWLVPIKPSEEAGQKAPTKVA